MNREAPRPGDYYRHFKNKLYEIVTVATHSETEEKYVVYHALYGSYQDYVRPYDMFMSEVDHDKYPEVRQKYRFEKVGDRISGLKETGELPEKEKASEEKKTPEETKTSAENVSDTAAAWTGGSREKDAPAAERHSVSEKPGKEDWHQGAPSSHSQQSLDLLNAFLDEESPEKRLELLAVRQEEVTKRFVENVSLVLDLNIPEGELEDQVYHLKRYLRTMMRYEGSRLR